MEEKKVAVRLEHVSKAYRLFKDKSHRITLLLQGKNAGKLHTAVEDISFEIMQGESVALIGVNGAGKSTLLKMITGVAYPSSGNLQVNGRISALLELTAGFDGEMTGRENMFFLGEVLGIRKKEMKELETAIIEFAELEEYIDQPVRTYSSGMKARLGFAIYVNVKPDILIVDETLSVGDNRFREKCLKKIRELVEGGTTVLLVTHSLASAKKFCERGIVLHQGKLLFDGTIEEAATYYQEKVVSVGKR